MTQNEENKGESALNRAIRDQRAQSESLRKFVQQMRALGVINPGEGLSSAIQDIRRRTDVASAVAALNRRIDVSNIVAAARVLPQPEELDAPPPPQTLEEMEPLGDPSVLTNERLDEVIIKLTAMEVMMEKVGATVATVGTSAAEFLLDFRAASQQADRVSKRAMTWAVIAVVSSFALTVLQIGYSEWRSARDDAEMARVSAEFGRKLDELVAGSKMTKAEREAIGAGAGTSP